VPYRPARPVETVGEEGVAERDVTTTGRTRRRGLLRRREPVADAPAGSGRTGETRGV
jgi:hypothetical protein